MALHHLWRHLATITAPLLLIALIAPAAPQEAAAQPKVARVYILEGGDAASDQAVAQALRARGLNVTRGVATHRFDGTQASLATYDVVVALYTANWDKPLPAGGLQAIRAFVQGGGGLVAGERLGQSGQLADLMPATNCGWGNATSTTYSQFAPHMINAGVPVSFTFSLGSFGGSESCLEPHADATVLYRSAAGGAGLVAWNVGQGRVAAFSTLLSATELANSAYRTLFQNAVAWSADVRDHTPPRVQRVDLADAGGMVRTRDITLQIKASDRGGAGVGAYIVAEFVFNSDGDTWRLASTTGWQRYRQPGAAVELALADVPGVHYLHVYVADRAGNISRRPEILLINYQPAGPVAIGLDEAHLYRVVLSGIPRAAARMQVFAGNPDLYVKGPGVLLTPQSDAQVEELTFAARTPGVYELGIVGQAAGSYSLTYGRAPLPPLVAGAAGGDWGIQKRARGSVINVAPEVPPEDPSDLPEPPVDTSTPSPEPAVYLPAIQRP